MLVNDIVPGLFTGPDRSQSQFSCSITDTDDWSLHCDLIKELLSELSPVIKEVVASGIDVEIDIAIDPEDYMDRWLTEFPLEIPLLSAVVTSGVTLRMSMYGNKDVGNTLPD